MSNISPEFKTILAGAKLLIEEGHIEEAEAAYRQLWSLARTHGNTADREATVLALVKFLRARGRAEEDQARDAEKQSEAFRGLLLSNEKGRD